MNSLSLVLLAMDSPKITHSAMKTELQTQATTPTTVSITHQNETLAIAVSLLMVPAPRGVTTSMTLPRKIAYEVLAPAAQAAARTAMARGAACFLSVKANRCRHDELACVPCCSCFS